MRKPRSRENVLQLAHHLHVEELHVEELHVEAPHVEANHVDANHSEGHGDDEDCLSYEHASVRWPSQPYSAACKGTKRSPGRLK